MTRNEKNRIDTLYQQSILSLEKNRARVADLQNKMAEPDLTPTDMNKISGAVRNMTQSIQADIKILESLAKVLSALEK
jgi:hypothetical protein